MQVLLQRFDPKENADRWYLVTVQQTLLDPVAIVCQYGSRHTTWQQTRVLPVSSDAEAQTLAKKIVTAKLKRGYEVKQATPAKLDFETLQAVPGSEP